MEFFSFFKLICEILKISPPALYVEYYYKYGGFCLKNISGEIISYDKKDALKTKTMIYSYKEDAIYINHFFLSDKIKCYAKLTKCLRAKYQMVVITHAFFENSTTIDAWKYCLKSAHQGKKDSPLELDKNAFCYVVMKRIFHVDLVFHVLREDAFLDLIKILAYRYDMVIDQYLL